MRWPRSPAAQCHRAPAGTAPPPRPPVMPARRIRGDARRSAPRRPALSAAAAGTEAASCAGPSVAATAAATPSRKNTAVSSGWTSSCGRETAEVAGAEVRAEGGEPRARHDDAEQDPGRRAQRSDDGAREQRRGELFPNGHALWRAAAQSRGDGGPPRATASRRRGMRP